MAFAELNNLELGQNNGDHCFAAAEVKIVASKMMTWAEVYRAEVAGSGPVVDSTDAAVLKVNLEFAVKKKARKATKPESKPAAKAKRVAQ
jgi:hypothetical protein